MSRPRHPRAGTGRRAGSILPALRAGTDPQRVRVLALLAPARETSRWKRDLRMGTPTRRASAVIALAAREGGRVALLLAGVLHGDRSAWVRQHAAGALAGLGPVAVKALVRAWSTEHDPAVRGALVAAMARVEGGNDTDSILSSAAAGPDAHLAGVALGGLARRGLAHGEHARNLVNHADASVRRAAVHALIEGRSDPAPLQLAARDPDITVARLATEGLRALAV